MSSRDIIVITFIELMLFELAEKLRLLVVIWLRDQRRVLLLNVQHRLIRNILQRPILILRRFLHMLSLNKAKILLAEGTNAACLLEKIILKHILITSLIIAKIPLTIQKHFTLSSIF